MRAKENALATVGAVNQGKVTRESRDGLTPGTKPKPLTLSMVRQRVTPRGRTIQAGRAFA